LLHGNSIEELSSGETSRRKLAIFSPKEQTEDAGIAVFPNHLKSF